MSKKKIPDVKDPQAYETLLKQGMDKKAAAKAAGAKDVEEEKDEAELPVKDKSGNDVDEKDLSTFEDWTDEQLQQKAKEKGISNYQDMDRLELIIALRNQKLKK